MCEIVDVRLWGMCANRVRMCCVGYVALPFILLTKPHFKCVRGVWENGEWGNNNARVNCQPSLSSLACRRS